MSTSTSTDLPSRADLQLMALLAPGKGHLYVKKLYLIHFAQIRIDRRGHARSPSCISRISIPYSLCRCHRLTIIVLGAGRAGTCPPPTGGDRRRRISRMSVKAEPCRQPTFEGASCGDDTLPHPKESTLSLVEEPALMVTIAHRRKSSLIAD